MCTFMAGLSVHIKQLLCTFSCVETMVLDQMLGWARVIMKDETGR